MQRSKVEIICEYGPFPGISRVNGVSFDGDNIWVASDDKLSAIDPNDGQVVRSLDVAAHAGTAFDGRYLYQIADDRIHKIEPMTGQILSSIPTPCEGDCSGLAWAEGLLWVGQYKGRKIHQVDPGTGEVLKTLESNRFVTGVAWAGGELWHGTWEDGESELRRIDPLSSEVLDSLEMPEGVNVSGIESDRDNRFLCGGGGTGSVRVVRCPTRESQG